jgi:hypothetical protein
MKEVKTEKMCFEIHKKLKLDCKKENCRQWLKCSQKHNCSLIAAEDGPMTLQSIGDLHGLTRMRICQIEKNAISKIKNIIFK